MDSDNGTVSPYWGLGNITKNEEHHFEETKQTYIYHVAFICLTLYVGVICREWLKRLRFPYTAFLFLFGCILGVVDRNLKQFRIMTDLAKFDSRLMMHIFLPVIIYESAYSLDPHMFFMALTQCLLLAVPGLLLCTSLTAVFARYILGEYGWDWSICFVFGAILSATDPVAVVALLKECSISSSLTTLIEGESLLNDGTAIVLFDSLIKVYEGGEFSVERIVSTFLYDCGVSIAVAYLISKGTVILLKRIELDTDIEVTFTFCIAYLTYYTSEVTLGVSGVLSVVVLGVNVASYKSSINYETEETSTIHQFWETLSFWANTLIFTFVGIIIASRSVIDFGDVGFIIATYAAVTFFRGVMIAVLSPILQSIGYGFTWDYGFVLVWGGLRGAVGLALVLIAQHSMSPETANQLLIQVSGIIFLTLVFNAPTMRTWLKLLGVGAVTPKGKKCMTQAVNLLRDAVSMTEKVTRMDKHMTGVDWMWVRSVTHVKNPYSDEKDMSANIPATFDENRGRCPSCKAEIKIAPNEEERRGLEEDSRLRILKAFESSVWNQHSHYGILRRTLRHLSSCVENAIDEPGKYIMAEDVTRNFLKISKLTRRTKRFMKKLLSKLRIEDRASIVSVYLKNLQMELTGFRRWCLNHYISRKLGVILFWVMLLNIVPIAGEIFSLLFEKIQKSTRQRFEREFIVFEVLNGVATLFYVYDAFVGLVGMGCRQYFHSHGNKIDFFVTTVAVAQALFDIVIISAFRTNYPFEFIYALVSMSCIRLLRLVWVTMSGILISVMDEACSVIYNAYDLGVGFLIANEEIAKTATKIVDYEPSSDLAQFTAENNIALDLSLKIQDILCASKHMPAKTGVRNVIKNVPWIKDENMLDMIMDKSNSSCYSDGDTVHESGTEQHDVKIITSGIVQVSGTNDESKSNRLPNTDSLWYFLKPGTFCEYLISPDTLGILGYLLRSKSVTSAICTKESELMNVSYRTLEEAEYRFGDLSFRMWRPIALKIAQFIIEEEEIYEYWSEERIKIHLEEGIFPDLSDTEIFEVHEAIADMVLIQGNALDFDTDVLYTGPVYIPSTVRKLHLIDDPASRPRVVMILLREEKYHSPTLMGWIKPKDISYKGLCLVHGIRRASLYGVEKLLVFRMGLLSLNFFDAKVTLEYSRA
ncbi:Sodium/hydrogen exchanger 7 like protein [Argiope bruennichi]|uniref:Sodium/hydrogen exchanger 7 like protein n=1 Tax=Argiope bruennichi TaxID=94029 RepID=A0A8T0FRF1_ARGBR|nr:Sodium/hydrogen exchanger 7 like protein [Argiope bruennichi]